MKSLLIAVLLPFAALGVLTNSVKAGNEPAVRFEKITEQINDRHLNNAELFEVWHDKVSGQEFTCAFGQPGEFAERGPSCFATGRTWK